VVELEVDLGFWSVIRQHCPDVVENIIVLAGAGTGAAHRELGTIGE
jgi:hypothetical protein